MSRKNNVEATAALNKQRTAIARTLKGELGMYNRQIGVYLGLHGSSVSHLIKHGTTGHA